MNSGQPGWLAHLDRSTEAFFLHHGTAAAFGLAVVCVVVAVGVYLPARITQVTLVLAMVVFAAIWVAVQNFGGILAGGATDPNSGLLVILLALVYWPLTTAGRTDRRVRAGCPRPDRGGSRTMTATPSWLYHLFAVLMLAVAAYCLTLLIVSVKERRLSGGTSTSPTSPWGWPWPACSSPAGPSARPGPGSSPSSC